jgi:hypothetical protein
VDNLQKQLTDERSNSQQLKQHNELLTHHAKELQDQLEKAVLAVEDWRQWVLRCMSVSMLERA